MSMRRFGMLAAMSLIAVCSSGAGARMGDDPLTRPIAPKQAARWATPQQPARIHGNSYMVGFGSLSVGLIKTRAGLVLIDGGVPQGVAQVERNIRALGFSIRDVKLILSTEPHFDHAGGLAALARDSGATVLAGAAAVPVLKAGRSGVEDPQRTWLEAFPAVGRVRAVSDGEAIRLGEVTVRAVATPGHTPGSTSWTWTSCEGRQCVPVVFASSLNPLAADGWRFTDPAHRGTVEAFRATFATMRALPCGILLTTHPAQPQMADRLKQLARRRSPNPFVDPGACKALADRSEAMLDDVLAKERAR